MSEILKLDPHQVIIGDRFRHADLSDVEARAASIAQFGQLQPIVVVKVGGQYELVAGLHRTEACKLNGSTVDAVLSEAVDELLRREMELEENIQRKDMHWTERERAIAALHKIRTERDPNWTQVKTQQMASAPRQADVSDAINLTKMMDLFPELQEAKSKHQALSWAKQKAASIIRVQEVRDNAPNYAGIEDRLILGDSVEVIKTIADGTFDLVLTDPPFGIDFDDRKVGSEGTLSSYEDDTTSYLRLLGMAPDLYRVIKPNGWLVWFLGITWYERAKLAFREAGFTVDEIPIVWDRSEGRCHTNRPDRYFGRAYDIALHCIKGDPQIVGKRSLPNIIRVPPVAQSEKEILVERPIELYAELLRRLTVPGEKVADFFAGSGSCPAACAQLKRDWFAVEQDPERRARAILKIKAHTPEEESAA